MHEHQKIDPFSDLFDLNVWLMLQVYFWPNYAIGQQDQWRNWIGSNLNGWKQFSLCQNRSNHAKS